MGGRIASFAKRDGNSHGRDCRAARGRHVGDWDGHVEGRGKIKLELLDNVPLVTPVGPAIRREDFREMKNYRLVLPARRLRMRRLIISTPAEKAREK